VTSFPRQTFGIGIGAIGDRYEDGVPRFGEFLAAEGIAAYLPTEGNRVPDFMLTYAKKPPKAVLLQGITWQGMFSDLIRFSTQPDADEIPLAELAEVGVERLGVARACAVPPRCWRRSRPASPAPHISASGSPTPPRLRTMAPRR
jgi:hypothetical protein